MFEFNGQPITLEQINAKAQAQGVDVDKYIEFLKTKGLKEDVGALRPIRPDEVPTGFGRVSTFDPVEPEADPTLESEVDLSFRQQMENVGSRLSPTWQNFLDQTVLGASDVVQNLFGDEAAYKALSPRVVGEFFENFNIGPFTSRYSKEAYKVKSYYDPSTNEIVNFNEEAFDKDGIDAVENEKYFNLAKKHKENKDDIKLFDARTNKPFVETYASEAQIMMNQVNKRISEFKPITDPGVTGFTDAVKKGEIDDAVAAAGSFILDMSAQMVAARVTKGKSMGAIMYGTSWKTYNDEKSKALYGEDDPDRIKKLIENGQENTAIPATLGAVGYALEKFGMDQITSAMLKKSGKGFVATTMKAQLTEGGTEYLQGLVEKFNEGLGQQKSAKEAAQGVADYMFSEEAADQFFAGLIGGGTMSAGGQAVQAAFRRDETSNQFVNEKIKTLAELEELKARTFDKKQRKQYDKAIKQVNEDLKDHLKRNKKVSDYLSEKQRNGLINILDQNKSTQKQINDLNKLFNKGIISAEEYTAEKEALDKKNAEQKKAINRIKNDANMSLVMQDLDASGKLIKDLGVVEQRVFKTESEFLEALKAEYLAQGKTEKQFKEDTEGYSIDGLKIGNVMFVNAEIAAQKNTFGTGTHELLHGVLKSTLQADDGSGDLNAQGEKIVRDFIDSLSSREKSYIEKKLKEGGYKINADGTEKQFKEYGEEYLNFYAQGAKENTFTLSAVEKAGKKIASIFKTQTEFKNLNFEDGNQTKEFLNAFVADSKKGIYRQEFAELAKEGAAMKQGDVKKSMTAEQRTTAENEIKRLGREGLIGDNLREEGIGKVLFDASFEDIYSRIKSEGFLDNLIAAKYKGDTVPRDFVDKVYSELTSHAKNFNPEQNDDFFGYLNSQIANKAGNVYNREYKVDQTAAGRARDIGETTQEGEVKVQVEADTDAALEALETEDLSVAGQAKAQAKRTQRQSKFRKQLGFETGGEMYNRVLQAAKKSVLIAYRKTQSIKDPAKRARAIKDLLRKEYFTKGLTSDLFKSTKNFLGTKDYIKNLKQYREVIIESLSTADLVQMERKVPDNERAFTVFDKKLTKIEDVESAVQRGLLPTEAINAIQKGQAVNLYRKRMPTESELVEFADQPAINPVTGQRSGLKGTRKDGFAKAIANTMVLDAVMEVRQSEDVVDALEDDAIAQLDLMALSDAVGREVDIKFSKSTAVADINNAIDNNINLAVYSQIKFSRSHREAYEARLAKKRTDLDEKQIKGAVESIFKFVESQNIPNNKKAKYEKMAMHYMANGYLILPEDGYKVVEAERIAAIKKVDPFSYKNPNELIEKFVGEVKGARTNPDTVKEFTNKTDVGSGVIVYDVADSKEGQLAVRKVIDTHFGKKANPWCLAARDNRIDQTYREFYNKQEADQFADEIKAQGYKVEIQFNQSEGFYEVYGDLMGEPGSATELDEAFAHWKQYNREGNGFKIAFKNGKLLCFRDGNKQQWWDRNDKASDKIHFTVTEKKGNVESVYNVSPEDGTKVLTKRTEGKMPNARVYFRSESANQIIESDVNYIDGAQESARIETTYKDKRLSQGIGVFDRYSANPDIQLNNITKDVAIIGKGEVEKTTIYEGKVVLTSKEFKEFEDKAVSIEHVTSLRDNETISLTINGVKQNIDVKFSRSAAEANYNKALNSIKFSRKKQDPYIADQLNIARELGNTSDEIIYARLEQELKNGTPLQEAHAVAFKEAYGDQAAEIIQQDGNSVKDLQQNINKFYLPKVRAFAKDVALKKYAKLIKATKDTEAQQDLINSFLINYGRPIRSGKVLNITTNRALLAEMEKAFGKEAMRPYELVPVDSGEKVMVNGEDIDLYKSITPIKADPARYADKVDEQADLAKKFLFEDVLQDDNLSDGEKKALVQLMFYGQKGPGRKLYKLGAYVEGMPVSKTTLEHEITANDMHNAIIDVIDGKMDINELSDIIDNAYVHVLPKEINDIFKKLGKTSKRNLQGYESMPEVLEYLQTLNLKGKTFTLDFSRTKDLKTLNNAVQFSRSTKNPTKGISILDFDDTLATSKSLVKFTRPDGTKGTLTPEQYASTYEDLSDLGYKFDFSEFSKVVDGKPAPLLNKAKKLASKFGTKDMFVLTARPADSAPAIREFLKQNGLDIPLKNITGLGNSTAEAKALWVADKVANGYNDFYFADDALKNVQAVQNMLDQFDVKSKVQQARVKFSRTMSDDFNKMLERTKGVPFDEAFSRARALKLGKNKGKFQIFVPPSADDFEGLLYYFVGKGEQGNKDLEFFKQAVIDPFSRAYTELDQSRQTIINDWDNLRKRHSEVANKLGDLMPASEFTFDNAIRVYLYNKAGHDIPGLSEQEVENMVERVKTDKALLAFAENLQVILKLDDVYVKPNEYWTAGSTASDVQEVSEKIRRAEFLSEWIENKNEIFNEANLNKVEATYGSRFRSALEDVLYRMETGRTRSSGSADAISNKWMRWLNNSVGAIMFINTKSALLQTISMINYVNYVDNNPLQAAKAFANQKQYWADFTMIFNSDFLKQRRKGLKTDVQTAEIASAVANATNKAQAAVAYLLKKGFLPTQMADSFAIAAGGATFYRNRVKTYLNEGLSQKEAEEKAFNDFRNSTEESQQSARPDRISQQQVSNAGRLLLNFQNYPMQQARLFKKALVGLARGTGNKKEHLSRIVFYGFAQNMIFLSLQNALFAMLFDHDDEEEEQKLFDTKMERILNGMVDTMLRGSGIAGGVIATGKNTILKAIQELEKGGRANEANIILEALNLSPAVGSKLRKINKGFRTYKYNKDAIDEMSKLNINNPIWTTAAPVIEGITNLPTDRSIRLINQVREGFNTDNSVAQRMSMLLGFSPYEIGVDPNKEVKEAKKKGKGKSTSDKKQCSAFTGIGVRCKNVTSSKSGRCYAHD